MEADAQGEAGALPLVENALDWLWERREGNRFSGRKYTAQDRLAGILSGSADDLLRGLDGGRRERALELLFSLVKVDPEGSQHTRRRIPHEEAEAIAGGGELGRDLVDLLSGRRDPDGGGQAGPLRLITVTEEAAGAERSGQNHHLVNLIHETLIRSKGPDGFGCCARPPSLSADHWVPRKRHGRRAAQSTRVFWDSWMTRRRRARRSMAAVFQSQSSRLLLPNSAKSST
jgi:hypothetical protein